MVLQKAAILQQDIDVKFNDGRIKGKDKLLKESHKKGPLLRPFLD